jgi:hypothetical protein
MSEVKEPWSGVVGGKAPSPRGCLGRLRHLIRSATATRQETSGVPSAPKPHPSQHLWRGDYPLEGERHPGGLRLR